MVAGKARESADLLSIITGLKAEVGLLAAIMRDKEGFSSTESRAIGVIGGSTLQGVAGYLPTAGDTMIGPIAFFPRLQAIEAEDNSLDISRERGDTFTSRVIVSAVSETLLDYIHGAAHAGQKLELQGVLTETYTIRESLVFPITNIVGDGATNIITVTVASTTLLATGEYIDIKGTVNFDISLARITVTGGTTFTYDLGSTGSATPESVGNMFRGNIRTFSGVDLVSIDNQNIELSFDSIANEWAVKGAEGSASGGSVPPGTIENQHLEWDNVLLDWLAVATETHGATGPFATTGLLNFANDIIIAASRNVGDTGDLQLKIAGAGFLEFTDDDNNAIGFSLRAKDAVNPDAVFTITQFSDLGGSGGTVTINAANSLSLDLDVDGMDMMFFSAAAALITVQQNMTFGGKNATGLGFIDFGAASADAGTIRLPNTASIQWESVPASAFHGEIEFDVDEAFIFSVPAAGKFTWFLGDAVKTEAAELNATEFKLSGASKLSTANAGIELAYNTGGWQIKVALNDAIKNQVDGADEFTVDASVLDAHVKKLQNLVDGTADQDAVTVKQLNENTAGFIRGPFGAIDNLVFSDVTLNRTFELNFIPTFAVNPAIFSPLAITPTNWTNPLTFTVT